MVRIQVIRKLDDSALKRLARAEEALEAARLRARDAREAFLESRGQRERDVWGAALEEENMLDEARWNLHKEYFLELSYAWGVPGRSQA